MFPLFQSFTITSLIIGLLFNGAVPAKAIINGQASDPTATGAVSVNGASGILVTNEWVMTTAHAGLQLLNPNNLITTMGDVNRTALYTIAHPSLDVLLVRLSSPISMNGSPTGYIRSLYPGSTELLLGSNPLNCYGYGPSDNQGTYNGLHVGAFDPVSFDQYTFSANGIGGVGVGPGDSGAPCLTSGPVNNAVAGVIKSGVTLRPEHFSQWALAHIYGRPVDLPTAWYAYTTPHPQFWDKPLQDSFTNEWTWKPCAPGVTYTWDATYQLEPNFDFIYITSNGVETTLNGYDGRTQGTGVGPLTVRVVTDASVQSEGMISMPIHCKDSNPPQPTHTTWVSPWPDPLPANYSSSTVWKPCVNNGLTYSIIGGFQFGENDSGQLQYQGEQGPTTVNVSENSPYPFMGQSTGGNLVLSVDTAANASSSGFYDMTADCAPDVPLTLTCHGVTCFSTPHPTPRQKSTSRWWDPCNGENFTWKIRYDFGNSASQVGVYDQNMNNYGIFTGTGSAQYLAGYGPLFITMTTDENPDQGYGLQELSAVCQDW